MMDAKNGIQPDNRLLMIQEQLLRFTQMDFSTTLIISEKGDDIDAIIVGMKTLAEELRSKNIQNS